MTKQRFLTIFYLIIGFCVLIIIGSYTAFSITEVGPAVDWTMKYFALPILILTTPICWYMYMKYIWEHGTIKYKLKIWTTLRTGFNIAVLSLSMTLIFIGTMLSLIILSNAYIGESKTINLNGEIIDYSTSTSKGRTRHYIKIQDPQFDRIIELKVFHRYEVGRQFNQNIEVGNWGLLYSK